MEGNLTAQTVPNFENGMKEWVNKAVSDTFDELLAEISVQPRFHISEELNRDVRLLAHQSSKIYDLINSYHAFCKLCEQHFYSRSVANDINSFFQKHLNTSYHKDTVKVNPPPDDIPMLFWKEKFIRGQCNVCQMSALDSYIIDTEIEPLELMKSHVCVWDRENRQNNEKVLRKLNLLKKYCGLKIFRDKYLKTVNGKEVCLLCGVKLPWPAEKATCHLISDRHYQKFCLFLKKYFDFSPIDVLNGFNLEKITRWLIIHEPPVVENFIDHDDLEISLQLSNSPENPYSVEKNNFSFSPKTVLENEEIDFMNKGECLICDVPFDPGHASSELHRTKAVNFQEKSFNTPEKYLIYCENRQKRLRMIENFKSLEMDESNDYIAQKKTVKQQGFTSHAKYFRSYFLKKLKCVNAIFTERYVGGIYSETEIFCEVCDMRIPVIHREPHLNSSGHKYAEQKWDDLKANFSNEKFMETFLKIKNWMVCLLCGIELNQNNFFSHLKGAAHTRRFIRYCNTNVDVPISSAILIGPDFSCYCTKCKTLLSEKMLYSTVKVLKFIKCHWPCLYLKEKDSEPEDESETITIANDSQKLVETRRARQDSFAPHSICEEENEMVSHSASCAKNTIDFKMVDKTVESIVNIFEEKIINSVINRTGNLIGPSHDSDQEVTKEEVEKAVTKEVLPNKREESSSKSIQRAPTTPATENKKEIEVEYKWVIKNEFEVQKTESNVGEPEEKEFVDSPGLPEEEDHEVLIIEGLPSSKRKYKVIYSTFKVFGKIRYVLFNGPEVILAFLEPGAAEIAANNPYIFVNLNKVFFTVSTRKSIELIEKKRPSLNRDLVLLLQNSQKLMDFVLKLVFQAVTLAESPEERKREEFVCKTILSAVLEYFPLGRCYPFGSRLSGLVSDNSDLDVFLDCGGMYEGFQNTSISSERKLVNKVARLLRKKKEIKEMVVVDRARVPIVSFLHKPTLIRCDLSFKNGLSIHKTLLIKFLLSLDWRVRPLILFLKHWAKVNGLHGPPYFSSYAIAMMVIFYLERLEPPVLPTVESLQNSYEGRRMNIAGWDCSINTKMSEHLKSANKDPLPRLLAGLFKFYANFDYNLYVISPLDGELLPREAFSLSGIANLPMCYKRHILNMPSPIETLVNQKIIICVMDPFDLSYIPTKSFTSHGLKMFIEFCHSSENYLKKTF